MNYWAYINIAAIIWLFYLRRRDVKRILYLEQRWAESQRRRSMYSQLVKPSKKALDAMGDFGIADIEEARHLNDIRKRLRRPTVGFAANKFMRESSLPNCPDPPDPPEPKPPILDTNIPGSSLKKEPDNRHK